MSDQISASFLHPERQSVGDVTQSLVDFLGSAREEVSVAIYDFHTDGPPAAAIAETLQQLDRDGVRVRMVDHDERVNDYKSCIPCPQKPPEYIDSLGLAVRPVTDRYGLMHHKYAVVDGTRVWTGSMNWNEDSFSLQENCVITVEDEATASAYLTNFEELWSSQEVEGSGEHDYAPRTLSTNGASAEVRPIFCPGRGPELATEIAKAVRKARDRVLICSPVLTSGPILGALTDVLEREGLRISGVVDGPMMRGVLRQWEDHNPDSWKPAAYRFIAKQTNLRGRPSTPWGPDRPHDYMHAKLMICDDEAFVGSYNHSRSGEENAENVLAIKGAGIVNELAADVEAVIERYTDGDSGAE
ncbi:MAG: phospholipase D-like domain-containing protein [Gaiellaceae bacterium]